MFTLTLHDRKGTELNEGDFVKISNGKQFTFFAEVKYLEKEGVIAPFHTFSFHSFEKVDEIPKEAKHSTEERYNIWYLYDEKAAKDKNAETFKDYLISWRECEHHLEKRSWRISKTIK